MIKDKLQEGLEAVEETLMTSIISEVEVLNDASKHILTSGGKRIRPQMALLAYDAAGGKDITKVAPLAAAVEMVHTATLVHDDINDHSATRRGKATVHTVWGRTFALLTGDFLFTKVYQLMAPYDSPYNVIMADATSKLVEGETLQAAAAKAGEIDRHTYKRIIALKTASLFEAAARMGAMQATADEALIEALSEYAYNLGLTFQIVDDILDIVGDPDEMGKPVGTDLVQSRGVMATQSSMVRQGNGETAVSTTTLPDEDDPIARMMASLRNSGAIEVAKMQAIETGQRARAALAIVPDSPARIQLESLIDLVLERQN